MATLYMKQNEDIMRALGRLEGKMDNVQETLNDHACRLQRVEMRSIRNGLISGAIISLATSLAVLGLKQNLDL